MFIEKFLGKKPKKIKNPYMVIAVGEMGGIIADDFAKFTEDPSAGITAINTDPGDLSGLVSIYERDKTMFGTSGVGGRWKKSRMETYAWLDRIMGRVTPKKNFPESHIHLFTLGLGGGTGSGTVPVLAEKLKRHYIEKNLGLKYSSVSAQSVLSLAAGMLPYGEEDKHFYFNTVCCISNLLDVVNGVILFDVDKIETMIIKLPWEKPYKPEKKSTFRDAYKSKITTYFTPVMATTLHLLTTSEENRMDYQDIMRMSQQNIPRYASLIVPCLSVNVKRIGDEKEKVRSVSELILKTAVYNSLAKCNPETALGAEFVYSGRGSEAEVKKAEKDLREYIYGDSVKGTFGRRTKDESVSLLLFDPDIPKLDEALHFFSFKTQNEYPTLIENELLSITDLFRSGFRLVSYLQERNKKRMKIDKIKLRMGESVIRKRREMPYRIPDGVITTWEFLFEELASAKKPKDVGIGYKEELEELSTLFKDYRSLVNEFASENEIKHQIEKLETWKPLIKRTMAEYVEEFFKPKIGEKTFEREKIERVKEIKPKPETVKIDEGAEKLYRELRKYSEHKVTPEEKKEEIRTQPPPDNIGKYLSYLHPKKEEETKTQPPPEKKMGVIVMDMLKKETGKIDFVRREDFEKKLNELVGKIKQIDLKFVAKELDEELYKSTKEDLIKNLIKVLDKGREMKWISKKRYKKMKIMCEGK